MAKFTAKKSDRAVVFSAGMDTALKDLFISELKDTYWAENHLTKALPKMIAAAGKTNLKTALKNHLAQTENQVRRLEKVFDLMNEEKLAKKNDAMEGLTISGEHIIATTLTGTNTRDLGILISGLKVENYEITVYNSLIQMAAKLKKPAAVKLLQQNLEEEIAASELLAAMSK